VLFGFKLFDSKMNQNGEWEKLERENFIVRNVDLICQAE
jgi:hypothetical protein